MTDKPKASRLSKVAREFNVGISTIVDFLAEQGIEIEAKPNTKIEPEVYTKLAIEFGDAKAEKEEAKLAGLSFEDRETITIADTKKSPSKRQKDEEVMIKNVGVDDVVKAKPDKDVEVSVVGKIDLDKDAEEKTEEAAAEDKPEETAEPVETIKAEAEKLSGPNVVGKIDLPVEKEKSDEPRKKRKRIKKVNVEEEGKKEAKAKARAKQKQAKPEVSEEEIQKEIKETLARLSGSGKSKGAKHRREKRQEIAEKRELEQMQAEEDKKVLKVTEFVTVSDLGNMMSVGVNEIISACMSLGIFASINQRLDAETLTLIAEEFGYEVEFVSAEVQESILEESDEDGDLVARPPIVTVMGHVDHGKTSLLDYVRQTNVIAGEAGGITQHIGAYHVKLKDDRQITFLDTPGHEAFTAMRARGAQVTDVAIIIIAADDDVMPQTKEAINHAQAANVPMVFAINKVDKEGANPDKIKEALSQMNILVEDWGGKFQCQEISAKKGDGIQELLDKVLLEAELLELKANPAKRAIGTVIESSLDKGKGYVTTVLVEAGTLRVGDIMLAGQYIGKVKAMHNERNQEVAEAGPAIPVIMLGLNGAPTAGDRFNVMMDEREAKQIATKREQLQREQGLRTQKHITLDEIGRRLAIGDFKELNVIVKGDVDGSIEALSDSLIKLSTESIQVNVIHKAVGQISESDVLLASASDAIIIGFQVRPSAGARKLAETEEIDIRLYSIIYNAIEEIKDAMEGMLSPDIEEKVLGTAEIREVFKISKVGSIAGCYVLDGKIMRSSKVRLIRDGIVIYDGLLGSLKRFKDDVKEVQHGYECGLNIENFNDIKVGDNIEAYEEVEIAKTLS